MENIIDSKKFNAINYLTRDDIDDVDVDLLIQKHKYLNDKIVDFYGIKEKAGDQFIRDMFDRALSRPEYSKAVSDFIKSDYLSDVFVDNLIYILKKSNECGNLVNMLLGKKINDLGFIELSVIYQELVNYYQEDVEKKEKNNLAISCLIPYLACLDGQGPKEFISNYFDNIKLGNYIIYNSGLAYATALTDGKKVDKKNLNEYNLLSMYKKVLKFRPDASKEFVKLVNNTKNMNAAAFISNFKEFAENDFSCDGLDYYDGEIKFDFINKITLLSLLRINKKINKEAKMDRLIQNRVSDDIKYNFNELVMEIRIEEKKLTK